MKKIQWYDLNTQLAIYIYPKLIDFIKHKKVGYPVRARTYKHWICILKEIVYAFEWYLSTNEIVGWTFAKFCKKYKLVNPYAKKPKKKRVTYQYNTIYPIHDNVTLLNQYSDRAQKGFELFGRYFLALWD